MEHSLYHSVFKARKRRPGYTIAEMVVVMVIMVIVVYVTSTILAGAVSLNQATSDITGANRRAHDVFNILKPALQHAGLGIPHDNLSYYMTGYGGSVAGSGIFSNSNWQKPFQVETPAGSHHGDVLRVVYALPTGAKHAGPDDIRAFSAENPEGAQADNVSLTMAAGEKLRGNSETDKLADLFASGRPGGLRMANDGLGYITFPGMGMHPVKVTAAAGKTLTLAGKAPMTTDDKRTYAMLPRNMIHAYADILTVRAGKAFCAEVGGHSYFFMVDATALGADPAIPANSVAADALTGFRVEGIKAIRFVPGPDNKSVTVWVLAESDKGSTHRGGMGFVENIVKNRKLPDGSDVWSGISWEDGVYYEDFFMTWRMRNIRPFN